MTHRYDQPETIDLTAEERAGLRALVIDEILTHSEQLRDAEAASDDYGARHRADAFVRLGITLSALGPAPSDTGPTTVEGTLVIQCLADMAGSQLETAWFQQDPISWIEWAPLAERLGQDVDETMPPPHPENNHPEPPRDDH